MIISTDNDKRVASSLIMDLDVSDGRKWVVNPVLYKKKRSIPQNKRYWVYVNFVSDRTGHTPSFIHVSFKHHFVAPLIGMEAMVPGLFGSMVDNPEVSTTALSTSQFADMTETIRLWILEEFGVDIDEDRMADMVNYYENLGRIKL